MPAKSTSLLALYSQKSIDSADNAYKYDEECNKKRNHILVVVK